MKRNTCNSQGSEQVHGQLTRRTLLRSGLAAGFATGMASLAGAAQDERRVSPGGVDESFLELRVYQISQGRMQDMHTRMRDHLVRLFSRHGIRLAGCWEGGSPPRPLFVYLIRWDSWRDRVAGWGGFYADPEWIRVRAATNAGREMVERMTLFMLRDHAPQLARQASPRLELHLVPIIIGQVPQALAALQTMAEAATRNGTPLLGVFEQLFGTDLPALILLTGGAGFSFAPMETTLGGPLTRYSLTPVPYPFTGDA